MSSDETLDPEILRSRSGSVDIDDAVMVEILFHPDLRRVGARAVLGSAQSEHARQEVVVGRETPIFRMVGWGDARPLQDPCVSRKQLTLRWVQERSGFELRQDAESRRELRRYTLDGTLLGDGPGFVPSGSLVAIGDRVLLLCTCRPLDVLGTDLGMVGESRAMVTLRGQIRALADTGDTVLIHGETGVGKELVARALHEASRRRKGPFLVVNCAAMPETLLESELFGHAKGAFSGAIAAKEGLFRSAAGGTLFLDEIGEMPLSMQAKLLRVLQERKVRPIGELQERPVDVRVVAATNRNLAAEVEAGRFRADLYSRLEGPAIRVPPLRERRDDIPRLFVHFLLQRIAEDAQVAGGTEPPLARLVIDPGAQQAPVPMDFFLKLLGREWMRNVRELDKYTAAVAALNRQKGEFRAPPQEPLGKAPEHLRGLSNSSPPSSSQGESTPARHLTEADLIREMEAHDHIQHRVARTLGISRTTLDKWLRELGIRRPKDIPREEIEAALQRIGGDMEQMARELKISVRGLKLRMTELGIHEPRR
ncbi:MAG: sigma-54 dependent transcriptional regulator [Myxococcales bacterium]|nr:sigma 54-interacting transcriptional regulator [Polyangiaceae bacterium]MDW8250957.1 sigma-54 dependent transcriptional regulator [Myxococcales bacterium]